jgi:hypothetical protein
MDIRSPREVELVLACARTQLDAQTIAHLKALVKQPLDWHFIVAVSDEQGVLPLVYTSLNTHCPNDVPADALQEMRRLFFANAQEALFLTAELLKILALFEANHIAAIPYKGPVLASSAYGNVALRQFVDLDLLVHKQDILRAKELLLQHDYRTLKDDSPEEDARLLKSGTYYDYILMRNDNRFKVELHWGLARWYFPFGLDPQELWTRLEQVSLGVSVCPNLLPDDLLLILTVHGAKHRWQRLKWICDIAELVRAKQQAIHWDEVTARAKQYGTYRILLLGLYLAHDLLGAALPESILCQIRAEPSLKHLTYLTQKVIFPGVYGYLTHSERINFYLAMRERRLDRLRYLLHLVGRFSPNEKDEDFMPVAGRAPMLGYVARPIRLLREYGLSSMKHILGINE